jgi:hypothetical protein
MKMAAYVAVLIGIWIGANYLWTMYNPSTGFLYMRSMSGMVKVRLAHYLSIGLPWLTLAAFIVWDRVEKKLGRPIAI